MSVTSDKLSTKIVNLRDSIGSSEVLWGNTDLRTKVDWRLTTGGTQLFRNSLTLRTACLYVFFLPHQVLKCAVPKTLQTVVSINKLQERLPDSYLRALFASYLASRFVYSTELDTSDFAFFEYIQRWVDAKDLSGF